MLISVERIVTPFFVQISRKMLDDANYVPYPPFVIIKFLFKSLSSEPPKSIQLDVVGTGEERRVTVHPKPRPSEISLNYYVHMKLGSMGMVITFSLVIFKFGVHITFFAALIYYSSIIFHVDIGLTRTVELTASQTTAKASAISTSTAGRTGKLSEFHRVYLPHQHA